MDAARLACSVMAFSEIGWVARGPGGRIHAFFAVRMTMNAILRETVLFQDIDEFHVYRRQPVLGLRKNLDFQDV